MTPDQIADILWTPTTINNLTLANRMVMGPMAANAPNKDGSPSEQTIAFFEARARGGIGMIICGGILSTPRATAESPVNALRLDIDTHIPAFKRVADAVHAHDVPIIAEISLSFGRMAVPGPDRPPLISASPINVVIPEDRFPNGFIVPGGQSTRMPREATIEEIQELERETVASAERAHQAGWDGVEVAAHMSYFAASFLSPRTNWRTDDYGGSVENRARLLVNIVREIRRRCGPDFVIGLRITANDYMPDGQGPEGFAAIAREVEKAGLDYVALSTGCYETMNESAPTLDGKLVDSGDARIFKEALSVPVLLQGLHDPARAASAIAEGHGDLVMLARPLLADPNYARKVAERRPDAIAKCNREHICMRRMVFKMPIRCPVNPEMGRESRGSKWPPPISRIARAPAEEAILKLTGSRRFMSLAGAFMKT